MIFEFSEEHRALRETARQLFSTAASEARVREVMASSEALDAQLWRRVSEELGLSALLVPADAGGADAGFVEAAIVLEEAGRRLAPVPLSATLIATATLREVGAESGTVLARIAEGASATLAWAELDGRWDRESVGCVAAESPNGWVLTGDKRYVVDGATAELILVVARTPMGVGLFSVDATAAGLTRVIEPSFDRTRSLARLHLDATAAQLVSDPSDPAMLDRVADVTGVLLAAEHLGVAQEAFELAVDYAKERVQFGRPIGSFQAIKHMCADLLLAVESARSAAYYAAWAADDGSDELPTVAPLARAFCADAAYAAASQNMQIHGGISFTWEHPAHLYFRRAKSSLQLFGSSDQHRDRVAAELGLAGDREQVVA